MAKGIGSLLDVAEGTNGASPDRQTYRHLLKKLYSDLSDDEIEEIMRSTDFSAIPLPSDVDLMGVTPTGPPPGVTTAATFGGASADALAGPSPQLGEDTEVQSDSDWLEDRRQSRAKRRGPFDRYLDQLLDPGSKGLLVQPSADPVVAEDPTEASDDRVQATALALKELHQKYGTPTDADPVVAEDPQEDPPPPSASGDWWQRYLTQAQSMISGRGDEQGIEVTDEQPRLTQEGVVTPSTQGDPTAEADLTGETEAVQERARQLIGLGMDPKQAMDLARRMAGFGSPPGQQEIPLPKQDKPQTGLRLLEAAANIGQSLFANRSMRKAQKQDRASQARANLINALSSRGGARGTQTTPSEGRLGALLGGVKGISEAIRGGRQAETKASQDQFANRLSLGKLADSNLERDLKERNYRLSQERHELQRDKEKRIAALAGVKTIGGEIFQLVQGEDGLVKVSIGNAGREPNRQTVRADDGSWWQLDRETDEWSQFLAGDLSAPNDVLDSYLDFMEEQGRKLGSWEEMLEDEGTQELYNSKTKEVQGGIRAAFMRGARLQAVDVAEKMEKLRAKMVTSATERLQMADARSFQGELDQIYKEVPIYNDDGEKIGSTVTGLWEEAGLRGFSFGVMSALGAGFDAKNENPKSGFLARYLFDDSANLNDALAGFGLKIARILNGGRPSDRDLVAAARLLPLQSDSPGLAQQKMRFLQNIFSERIVAIREEQSRVQEGGGEYVPRDLYHKYEEFIQDNGLTADGQEMERDLGTTGGTVEGSESDFE